MLYSITYKYTGGEIKNFNREKKGAGGLTTTEGSPDREPYKTPT